MYNYLLLSIVTIISMIVKFQFRINILVIVTRHWQYFVILCRVSSKITYLLCHFFLRNPWEIYMLAPNLLLHQLGDKWWAKIFFCNFFRIFFLIKKNYRKTMIPRLGCRSSFVSKDRSFKHAIRLQGLTIIQFENPHFCNRLKLMHLYL